MLDKAFQKTILFSLLLILSACETHKCRTEGRILIKGRGVNLDVIIKVLTAKERAKRVINSPKAIKREPDIEYFLSPKIVNNVIAELHKNP